jgi:hypothetical protein
MAQWRPKLAHSATHVLPKVVGLTQAAGVDLPDPKAMRDLCEVPRRVVEKERRWALLAMKDQDAAQFAAKVTPRIRRDRSHLRPCEWVAGDVHHLDIKVLRPDGTATTPKAVAWLDLANNRAWFDVHIMPEGEMIRTEHVIRSFVAMCADPNWGVPSHLYLDNGSEYKWAELTVDIAKLKKSIDVQFDEQLCLATGDRAKAVQNARPYNPQAKVIEGLFSTLERSAFSQLPGYIGGNRMSKKTANQGREPDPFPGDEARLVIREVPESGPGARRRSGWTWRPSRRRPIGSMASGPWQRLSPCMGLPPPPPVMA